MTKIPTIFERDGVVDRSRVLSKPNPDCAWVFAGEGVATQKLDGTCCAVIAGTFLKRRELAPGASVPADFILIGHDNNTQKRVGWMPVEPADKWHIEGLTAAGGVLPDGTYELIGPKVQGNPEKAPAHLLVSHAGGVQVLADAPRDFDGLAAYLAVRDMEGIVFHHPDGRMAKIKGRDFGIKRGAL